MVRNIRPTWIMIYFDCLIMIFHHYHNCDSIEDFTPIASIILYIKKIVDYLKILTDNEVKDFCHKCWGIF